MTRGHFQLALDHHLENIQSQIMKTNTRTQFSCLCSFQRNPHFLMNSENCKLREKFNHIIMKSHRGVASSLKERLKLPPRDLYLSRLSSFKNIYFKFVIWAATFESACLTEFSFCSVVNKSSEKGPTVSIPRWGWSWRQGTRGGTSS